MDNSIYEVEREEYKIFLDQLDLREMDREEAWLDKTHIIKIVSKKTGKHLCSRIGDDELQEEHYFIFNYPDDDETVAPQPKLKINLKTKEEVQAFFDALAKLQKEANKND